MTHKKTPERDPPNEKPLKLDMPFEDAVRRFMQSPPMPKEERRPKGRERGRDKGE